MPIAWSANILPNVDVDLATLETHTKPVCHLLLLNVSKTRIVPQTKCV